MHWKDAIELSECECAVTPTDTRVLASKTKAGDFIIVRNIPQTVAGFVAYWQELLTERQANMIDNWEPLRPK